MSSGAPTSDVFTSGVAETVDKCRQVTVALGEAAESEKGLRMPLTMKNTGSSVCVLHGFPGVQLQGRDGDKWDLLRSGDAVVDVRLTPGATTVSYLTYLRAEDGKGWDITSVLVTPPDTTESQAFRWPGGSVVRQDAATHPGTFVGPVGVWAAGGA